MRKVRNILAAWAVLSVVAGVAFGRLLADGGRLYDWQEQ